MQKQIAIVVYKGDHTSS